MRSTLLGTRRCHALRFVEPSRFCRRTCANAGPRAPEATLDNSGSTAEGEELDDAVPELLPSLLAADSIAADPNDAQRKALWKAAIKLPMYWVAVIPVMVGAAVGYYETGILQIGHTLRLLVGAVCIIGWLNLSNDVFDHETGADVMKHESTMNLVQNKSLIPALSLILLALGITLLGSLMISQPTQSASIMLGLAILCGYLYQGPPFSYQGLGEPLCFVAFGPLATSAFYMILSGAQTVSGSCWAASILVGISTTLVLFCSHFHQYDTDRAAQKFSPIVRLGGPQNALPILTGSVMGLFLMMAGMSVLGLLPQLLIPRASTGLVETSIPEATCSETAFTPRHRSHLFFHPR